MKKKTTRKKMTKADKALFEKMLNEIRSVYRIKLLTVWEDQTRSGTVITLHPRVVNWNEDSNTLRISDNDLVDYWIDAAFNDDDENCQNCDDYSCQNCQRLLAEEQVLLEEAKYTAITTQVVGV